MRDLIRPTRDTSSRRRRKSGLSLKTEVGFSDQARRRKVRKARKNVVGFGVGHFD